MGHPTSARCLKDRASNPSTPKNSRRINQGRQRSHANGQGLFGSKQQFPFSPKPRTSATAARPLRPRPAMTKSSKLFLANAFAFPRTRTGAELPPALERCARLPAAIFIAALRGRSTDAAENCRSAPRSRHAARIERRRVGPESRAPPGHARRQAPEAEEHKP